MRAKHIKQRCDGKSGGKKCDFVNHTKSCLRKLINQKKYEA